MSTNATSWKVFSDPVHGHISLHPACMAIVDTPQFQRLRNIKQLGGGYFVYPGASHNRFEHSLGVCHLAGKLLRALKARQDNEIDENDIRCVEIAALCHDLGSGPLSQVFETLFIPQARKNCRQWQHKKASLKMFDHMLEENRGLKETVIKEGKLKEELDLNFVRNLICPPSVDEEERPDGRDKKKFLYEILPNDNNEFDVDKWDYLLRDCLHLGMHSNFDHDRYICFARVTDVGGRKQICVRDKEQFSVFHLFQTHHFLSKKAYRHRVCNAVEYMLVDALMFAEEVPLIPGKGRQLKTASHCIDDMTAYTNLTDNIFYQIRISIDDRLKKSQDLLKALDQRKIFICVGESRPIANSKCAILNEDCHVLEKEKKIKSKLWGLLSQKQLKMKEECIQVQIVTLDFGKEDKGPLRNLYFYTKHYPDKAKEVDPEEVSHLFPQKEFQEQVVRVYLKHYWNDNEQLVVKHERSDRVHVGTAFKSWCEKELRQSPALFCQDLQYPTQEGVMDK